MIGPSKGIWMVGKRFVKHKNPPEFVFSKAFCLGCFRNMASVPHGALAAMKVRKNEEKRKEFFCTTELNPMNYSSKYMNSIWGQYNRYSVHNLKKIMDDNIFSLSASKDKRSFAATQSVEKPNISTDIGSAISFASNKMFN